MSPRGLSLVGMIFVADGVAALLHPSEHSRTWSGPRAPAWYQRAAEFFAERPALTRALALVELGLGAAVLGTSARAVESRSRERVAGGVLTGRARARVGS